MGRVVARRGRLDGVVVGNGGQFARRRYSNGRVRHGPEMRRPRAPRSGTPTAIGMVARITYYQTKIAAEL